MREMRDSGVEWIGEIPKDWNCCKQKYRFTLINGRAFKDNEFEEDGTYRILRVGNLFSNPVWYSSSLELEPDKYCEKGDLIYAWSMSYGPYIWNEEKVIYHYHIWKTKLVSDMDKMFSYYYLQALTESIKSQTHETTMGFVTMGIMNNSYIAYPRNIKEQKKISDYLDAKCSKIDEIIEKQLSIIEKLKEYKLSIITEAVTSGINPDVEMKDIILCIYSNAKRKNIAAVWSEGCGRNLQTFPYLFYETGNRGAFHLGCFAELYDLQNVL